MLSRSPMTPAPSGDPNGGAPSGSRPSPARPRRAPTRAKARCAGWGARRVTWLTAASCAWLLQTPQCIVNTARWLFSV